MSQPLKISVVGAGIGGLAAAVALRRRGTAVTLRERSPDLGEVGAGIQIGPNGMRILDALDLGDAVRKASVTIEAVRLIDGLSGWEIASLPIRAAGHSWQAVHRARLIDVLADAARAEGVQLQLGEDVDPPVGGAPLSGDDLLVGADGLRSRVRQGVVGEERLRFSGQVAWRALVRDESAAPVVRLYFGPGRHLVTYPLAGGLRNIVAVEERGAWTEEGWSHPGEPDQLRSAFHDFHPDVSKILSRVETAFVWGLFRHPVAPRWFAGRQVLVGDAAHPTLPFLAQGANLALEDAWVLAALLGGNAPDEALSLYERARKDRARRVVRAADGNARLYHLRGPIRGIVHAGLHALGTVAPTLPLRRFDFVYRHDVTALYP